MEGKVSKDEEHEDRELLFDVLGKEMGGERINEVFFITN